MKKNLVLMLCFFISFFSGMFFKANITNETGSIKILNETSESRIKIPSNKEFVVVEIKSGGVLKNDVDMSCFETPVASFSPYNQTIELHAVPKQIFLPKEIYQSSNIVYNEQRLIIESSKAYQWGVVVILLEDNKFEVVNLYLW